MVVYIAESVFDDFYVECAKSLFSFVSLFFFPFIFIFISIWFCKYVQQFPIVLWWCFFSFKNSGLCFCFSFFSWTSITFSRAVVLYTMMRRNYKLNWVKIQERKQNATLLIFIGLCLCVCLLFSSLPSRSFTVAIFFTIDWI